MRRVAIVGAGMTPFGEHFALGIKDLLPMAFAECARQRRQGRCARRICKRPGSARWAPPTASRPASSPTRSGLPDLPVTRVENSCATGNDAVRNALFGVASGAFDVALVMGADKIRETSTSADMLWEWEAMARDMAWDYPLGLVSPAGFALHVAALSARVAGHRGTPGDGGGEEPPARRQQPEGPVAVRDHHGAGA